jgi:hypothetical protein
MKTTSETREELKDYHATQIMKRLLNTPCSEDSAVRKEELNKLKRASELEKAILAKYPYTPKEEIKKYIEAEERKYALQGK